MLSVRTFVVNDLGINSVPEAPIIPENFEVNEEDEKRVRQLISLSRSLKKEQESASRSFPQIVCQQAVQSAVDQAWADHSIYFQVSVSKNLGQAEATEQSAQRLLAGRLLLDQAQLAVIGIANLPMLGLHGSGQIKSLVTRIASEIRQSPSLTTCVGDWKGFHAGQGTKSSCATGTAES